MGKGFSCFRASGQLVLGRQTRNIYYQYPLRAGEKGCLDPHRDREKKLQEYPPKAVDPQVANAKGASYNNSIFEGLR